MCVQCGLISINTTQWTSTVPIYTSGMYLYEFIEPKAIGNVVMIKVI